MRDVPKRAGHLLVIEADILGIREWNVADFEELHFLEMEENNILFQAENRRAFQHRTSSTGFTVNTFWSCESSSHLRSTRRVTVVFSSSRFSSILRVLISKKALPISSLFFESCNVSRRVRSWTRFASSCCFSVGTGG